MLGVASTIIDDLTLEVCFEVHKKLKTGRICPKCSTQLLGTSSSGDIFGTNPNNYVPESVTCLNKDCERNLAASRYAPHLEKCLRIKGRGNGTRQQRYVDYNDGQPEEF